MTKLYRMPDLPIEYVRYLDNNPYYIIFMEKYFIKRVINKKVNVDVLCKIADLEIEGFNNHKKVFIDDCEEFIYLNAPYLNNHTEMIATLQKMIVQEILSSFAYLFTHLRVANKKGLNPHDIKFSNYKMSPDGNPIFTDFDFSFYQCESTQLNIQTPIFEQLNEFVKTVDLKDPKVLNLNDKMLALKMLFQALSNTYAYECNPKEYIDTLRNSYNALKSKYYIDPKVDEYIISILYEFNPPQEDDYFIDTIINPLLEGGLELKKTAN